jgi:hypothetical protein
MYDAPRVQEMHQGCDFFRLAQAVHGDLLIDDQFGPGRQDRRLDLTRAIALTGFGSNGTKNQRKL